MATCRKSLRHKADHIIRGDSSIAIGVYGDPGQRSVVDNVGIGVPEPASLALLAAGGLMLLRRRRR